MQYREVKYLSPTSVRQFYEDREVFFCKYLAEQRSGYEPQTEPMSVGSAFDAFIKSHLFERLLGKGHKLAPEFERDTLFEKQVEPANRDFARKAGEHCYLVYTRTGALSDLMFYLEKAISEPRFELDIVAPVTYKGEEIIFKGKPDLYFLNEEGHPVIIDWKVNGYCSKWNTSPKKGYIKLKTMEGDKPHHKEAVLQRRNGMLINVGTTLEFVDEDWADQLSVYGWLCGAAVGEQVIVGLDQLVCNNPHQAALPTIRIAEHRLTTSVRHQTQFFEKALKVWKLCHSNHFFEDLSFEDSTNRGILLNQRCKTDKEFSEILS